MMNVNSPIVLAAKLEECRETKIEKLVIDLCVEAGFLTKQDMKEKSCRYQWIRKLTEYCADAMALEDVAKGESMLPVTIINCDKILAKKQEKASAIVAVVAKEIMRAVPPYQG